MLPLFRAATFFAVGRVPAVMSQNDAEDEPNGLSERLRTVTPPSGMHRNVEMDTIGWAIFAGILVISLPLLPILVVGWVLMKLFDSLFGRATE